VTCCWIHSENWRGHWRGAAQFARAHGMLYINVTRDGQRTFFGSRGPISLWPSKSSSQLASFLRCGASCGLQFSQSGPEKWRGGSCGSFIHAANWFLSMLGWSRVSEYQKNPAIAPSGRSSFCKQRRGRQSHGRSNPREHFCDSSGQARRNSDEIGKTRLPDFGWRILREVPSFTVRCGFNGRCDASRGILQGRMRGWSHARRHLCQCRRSSRASRVGRNDAVGYRGTLKVLRTQRLKGTWRKYDCKYCLGRPDTRL